jgi:hypothetical protein
MLRVPSTLADDCLSIRLDAGYTRSILFVPDRHGVGGCQKSHPLPKIVAAQGGEWLSKSALFWLLSAVLFCYFHLEMNRRKYVGQFFARKLDKQGRRRSPASSCCSLSVHNPG